MTTTHHAVNETALVAAREVEGWSRSVAAWKIDDIRAEVATWQTTEAKARGKDMLANVQVILRALGQLASAVEISILKMDVERDLAKLNPAIPKTETGRGHKSQSKDDTLSKQTKSDIRKAHQTDDKQYQTIIEAHREAQVEVSRQAIKDLASVSKEYLAEAVAAVKRGVAPSLLAWHKTYQARTQGTDLMAELEAVSKPRNPRSIYLGTLAQLQSLLAKSDTIICQQRTFQALPQDTQNSGAVLDLDAMTTPQIIKEQGIRE